MASKRSVLICCLIGVAFLIGACETIGVRETPPPTTTDTQQAERLYQQGDYSAAARLYARIAASESGPAVPVWRFRAAEAWLRSDEPRRARTELQLINRTDLRGEQVIEYDLLATEIALAAGNPEQALTILGQIENLPETQTARAQELRAQALFASGDATGGVVLLVEREIWLTDANAIFNNHQQIWNGMRIAARGGSVLETPEAIDAVTAGWLALGRIDMEAGRNPFEFRSRIELWREAYPDHPANSFVIGSILPEHRSLLDYPQQIAILLPLSGRRRAPAQAVRDGFLAGYFQHVKNGGRSLIKIYDVDTLGVDDAYQQAVGDGSDFIVGPLQKNAVQTIADYAGQVTTLTLNYLPVSETIPAAFYQFGLLPEDEARQVADRAIADGHWRAIALVPDTAWGTRMLEAFSEQFQALGGVLLAYETYYAQQTDYSQQIRQVLNLDGSNQRYRDVTAATGLNLTFEPRRRKDVDFIFLATLANQGRLIPSQLRYHYATGVPVYTTSSAFQPGASENRELEGVIINDIPWNIQPDPSAAQLRRVIDYYWPSNAERWPSLFALGFDAYRLISLIHNQQQTVDWVPGMTGELSIAPDGRVRRRLDWARIESGERIPLPDTAPSPETIGATH